MKRHSAIALLVAGFAALAYAPQASSETGWTTLFDGKSLDGFTKVGDANWRIEDGMIVADRPSRGTCRRAEFPGSAPGLGRPRGCCAYFTVRVAVPEELA